MIGTLVNVILGAVIFVIPSLAASQDIGPPDFLREQVEAATKEFDRFVERARSVYGLPFTFPEKQKHDLVLKYLRDADKSPFFWKYLSKTFSRAANGMPKGEMPPPEAEAAAYIVRESYGT